MITRLKTPQAIGAVHRLWKEGKAKKALVICPSSLKYQWKKEVEKFTSHQALVIDGTPKQRKEQIQFLKETNDYLFTIINYELVRSDVNLLKEISWDVITCDEVHRIKNIRSKTSEAIKQLDAPYKFGLTGTPMQNRPEELFNIFDWLDPSILGNYWAFRKRYMVIGEKFGKKNVIIGYKRLGELRERVSKYMLRRMKADVAPELPKMIFNTYRIPMTPEQERIQAAIQEDFLALVQEIQEFQQQAQGYYDENGEWVAPQHPKEAQILGYFNLLLSVSDAPELLLMSDSPMAQRYAQGLSSKPASPKLDELERIAQEQLEAGNRKMVIFTQFARMQKLAVERLQKYGGVEMINGSMGAQERQQALERFEQDPNINFMVCTDAANYGSIRPLYLAIGREKPRICWEVVIQPFVPKG